MGWITLTEAAKRGPALPVWERRVEHDRVPHYLDAASGRRMVWVSEKDPNASLEADMRETLERLDRLERLLSGGQWTTIRRAAAAVIAPARPVRPQRATPPPIVLRPPIEATPEEEPALAQAIRSASPGAPGEVIRLYELAGNDRAAAELLGRNRSEFWRWRTGKRRIGKANLERVREAIVGLESRRAA